MIEVTRRPTRISSVAATLAGGVAVLSAALGGPAGPTVGLVGFLVLGLGLHRGIYGAVDIGAGLVFLGVLFGGLQGAPVEATVLGAVTALVAWDLGTSAVELGSQLGREADTRRLEGVQLLSSLSVGLLTATVGYGAYVFGAGGQPAGAVVLLLLSVLFVVVGLKGR
ncbi:DUF7519 family protein [Natronosalvus vescus]|uniref:DUF7519 family protein n=1 Tax=Natronosalvus vescus TaxID=2953881 RepID=UPI00209107BD|nr:hypothetical protein [Natronosalvus vescus]